MTPSGAAGVGVCPGCFGAGRVERIVPYPDVFPCALCLGAGVWPTVPRNVDELVAELRADVRELER